jgi:hypothetical protein
MSFRNKSGKLFQTSLMFEGKAGTGEYQKFFQVQTL